VFGYSYGDEYRDRDGRVRERWRHFGCPPAQHDGARPVLRIVPERFFDRAVQRLGQVGIDLESEEFNRTFVVRCQDRRFATDLLSPEMMELLLGTRGRPRPRRRPAVPGRRGPLGGGPAPTWLTSLAGRAGFGGGRRAPR
jgi:hypothetical protein